MAEKEMAMFRANLVDPKTALEQLEGGAKVGEADVLVAAFDVPDDAAPVGVFTRQVIDRGSFRSIIEDRDTTKYPVPYFVDHGHAHVNGGMVDSTLKIGKADKFREEEPGLVFRGLFNLQKELARDTFSDMLFDPANTPHSFRWNEDKRYRSSDGWEHVNWFDDLHEVSYCGRAAQMMTGVLPSTMQARSPATIEEIKVWVQEDGKFGDALREAVGVEGGGSRTPEPKAFLTELAVAETQKALIAELRNSDDARQLLRTVLAEAERPDPATEFYQDLWASRAS